MRSETGYFVSKNEYIPFYDFQAFLLLSASIVSSLASRALKIKIKLHIYFIGHPSLACTFLRNDDRASTVKINRLQ